MTKFDDQEQFSLPRKSEVTEFQSQMDLIPSASPLQKGEGERTCHFP